MAAPAYSVVLPVYNEASNLPELYKRLTAAMHELGEPYELLFIDDGSQDASAEVIKQLHATDPAIKLIRFSRNFGHQHALTAGLAYATGQAVILMDSDLQDLPEDIPKLVASWKAGYAVVYAVRETRKENWFKQVCYRGFYRLLKRYAEIEIPLDSGDFCVMDRKVVNLLNRLPEKNRFIRGLRAWVGFSQIGIPVQRDHRFSGTPKYRLRDLMHLALTGLLSFSVAPLRIATSFGLLVSFSSFLSIFIVVYFRLFTHISIPGFAATASILLFLGGVQLLTIGILGEYISKIYNEVKQRPLFIIAETLNLSSDTSQSQTLV